jgi:hypothetical protein
VTVSAPSTARKERLSPHPAARCTRGESPPPGEGDLNAVRFAPNALTLEGAHSVEICSVSLSSLTAFDVPRQFLEGLIAEFDRAESDRRLALGLGRMQLP